MTRNWKFYALMALALLLPAGVVVSISLMPIWLYITVFLALLLVITACTWKAEGARKALGRFLKELFFGW